MTRRTSKMESANPPKVAPRTIIDLLGFDFLSGLTAGSTTTRDIVCLDSSSLASSSIGCKKPLTLEKVSYSAYNLKYSNPTDVAFFKGKFPAKPGLDSTSDTLLRILAIKSF